MLTIIAGQWVTVQQDFYGIISVHGESVPARLLHVEVPDEYAQEIVIWKSSARVTAPVYLVHVLGTLEIARCGIVDNQILKCIVILWMARVGSAS